MAAICIFAACLLIYPSSAEAAGWWKESGSDTANLSVSNGVTGSAEVLWSSAVGNAGYTSPHGGFTTTSNLCKTCHAIHGAGLSSYRLLKSGNTTETRTSGEDFGATGMGSSRANECMYCHDANSGASSKRPYELGVIPGTVIRGEHTLGATSVPDSDVNGGGAGSGNLADRGGPYLDGKQVLICYSCHSVHGANIIGQDNNHDGTLDSPNAVNGNAIFDGATFDAGDGFENWNTKILRIDPANDGSILATGSQGALSNNQWATEMGMSTADGGALAVRTGFCADCHNRNPNWETDTSDARPNPKSHPQGRGTDSMVDAYGVSVEVAAHPLEKMGCRGCHFATNNSTRPGPSRFPHQTVGYKLLYDEATQDVTSSDTGSPYRAINRMDSICLSCHRVGVEPMGGYDEQEEAACLECHDSKYGAPDIGDEIRKTYAMPIVATHDVHTNDEAQTRDSFAYPAKRHVECVDCHNPKRIYPWVDNPLTGIWGVSTAYDSALGYGNALYAFRSQVQNEYDLCYKCHSSYTTVPSSTTYRNTDYTDYKLDNGSPLPQGNRAFELNPANSSFHPVQGPGRNVSINLCRSLQTAFGLSCGTTLDAQTSLQNIRLKCTDCHNNNEIASEKMGASSNYTGTKPTGPHGSTNKWILRAAYDRDLSIPRNHSVGTEDLKDRFALCFTCHDINLLLGGVADTNFAGGDAMATQLHSWHLQGGAYSGSPIRAKCADCHYNIHGNAQANNTYYQYSGGGGALLSRPGKWWKSGLVNFAPHVQGTSKTKPFFNWLNCNSTTKKVTRYCELRCHNGSTGASYTMLNWYGSNRPNDHTYTSCAILSLSR